MRRVLFLKIDIPAQDDPDAVAKARSIVSKIRESHEFKVEAKLQKVYPDRAPVGMRIRE